MTNLYYTWEWGQHYTTLYSDHMTYLFGEGDEDW